MLVTLEDVVVRLGRREVLSGLTWQLPTQGRTLLLGRNGVGKTTTMRVASGALRPRRGTVKIDGAHSPTEQLRRVVALMPQHISSVPGLSVLEQVAFASWLAGRPESAARRAAEEALTHVDLHDLRDRKPATLSGGELRRVGLAEALARPAKVLLLDEPTAGLDPLQRANFRDLLISVDRPTVVSTHQLDDVDALFTRVEVLEAGRVVFSGTTDEFLAHGDGPETAKRAESAFAALTGQR